MEILHLVDELEAIISKSFRIPFTSNIVINEDAIYDILDQMRVSVPQEVKEAKRTEAERERILARAEEEANRLVDMAKEKMMLAVDDQEIIEFSRNRGEEIIHQAEKDANQLKTDANVYVAEHLSNLEEHLLKLLTTVRNGLRQIESAEPAPSTNQSPSGTAGSNERTD